MTSDFKLPSTVEDAEKMLKEHADEIDKWLEDPENSKLAIKKAANIILERGDVLKFLVNQAQKNHIGDTDVIKHLLASIACTNSLTSAGIQPELNGEKGHGKTDAVKAVFHLVPDKFKLSASISAKALYYYQDLPAGAIIFSDDVQWSEDLISTVKRSMGNFQEPQKHFTLDKNRNPLPHIMPPRLVWWLSSVESVADDQLKDRQYSLDIEEGADHSREVSDYLRRSRSRKIVRFSVDRGIEVAREIISQIRGHDPFKVLIDCAEIADWKVKEDHRTQNKFWDLVEAFAILRFKQRYIDNDGWLHATVEDFNEAKTIFMKRKANHRTHLTNAQTRIVKSVIALQNEANGATQARIAEDLGISMPAVCRSINAIEANTRFVVHSPGIHGEKFYRCTVAALEVVYGEGDIVSLPEDYRDPINPDLPSINHGLTNRLTNKINNSNNNHIYNKPISEEYSNEVSERTLVNSNIAMPGKMVNPSDKNHQNSPIDSENPGKSIVNQMVNSGVNGEVNSVILRFLKFTPAFVGGDLRTYGPFRREDIATVPCINANGLVLRGVAVQVVPGSMA